MVNEKNNALPVKPKLRGVLHQYGFFISLPLGGWMMSLADGGGDFWPILVYCIGLSALLGTSALYHRIDWPEDKRMRMRRLDRTMIFVLIATTYTPFGVLAFTGSKNTFVLRALWGAVLVGFVLNFLWVKAPKWLIASLYVIVGWLVALMLPEYHQQTGSTIAGLMLAGGISYTVGAAFYAFKGPNLVPGVFGYHELFHLFVLIGAGFHYAAVHNLIV